MDEMLLPICNHYAPHVVPFILQQTDLTDPQFIAVRIVTGGSFGRYVLQLYELDGGKCGEKLN